MNQGKADIILKSQAVFRGGGRPVGPAVVAVRDRHIVAVGSDKDIESLVGPGTKVLDFGHKLITPGFHDFHIHLFLGSLVLSSVGLGSAKSEEEAAKMVADYARNRPDDPWVIGWGWYHVFWDRKVLPHKSSLDKYIPDRPVFLFNAELHGAWVNSKALEMISVTSDTPDPPSGRIERDDSGEPTGFLYETAMSLAKQAFNLPYKQKMELMDNFLRHAAQLGVTSVSDMLPLLNMELGDLELYRHYNELDLLSTRIHFLATLNSDLERPRQLREQFRSPRLQFSGLKNFLDGVPITYTAFLIDPYSDRPDTRGYPMLDPDEVRDWVVAADRDGFRVRLHACGDAAVRLGLDCYEAAQRQNGWRDSRHTIEHIEVIHSDDIPRFANLGVIASMQPEHITSTKNFVDNPYQYRFAGERERYMWMIRTLKSCGTHMAFGTDFPVVGLDPFVTLYRAVTRVHDDGKPEGGWNPKERILLEEALAHYTEGPAYANFRERELGTLDVGKLADIIVMDRNPFALEPAAIRETKVQMTMMDGRVVYEA
jgi:predicted amidohydrolase YtcJ